MGISDRSLDVCSSVLLVRTARNFDSRGCRILRRRQQGRDQADQETDRNRAEDHIAPAHGDAQILAQYGWAAIFRLRLQQGCRDHRVARVQSDISHIIAGFSAGRSEEHKSELKSLMRISYDVS